MGRREWELVQNNKRTVCVAMGEVESDLRAGCRRFISDEATLDFFAPLLFHSARVQLLGGRVAFSSRGHEEHDLQHVLQIMADEVGLQLNRHPQHVRQHLGRIATPGSQPEGQPWCYKCGFCHGSYETTNYADDLEGLFYPPHSRCERCRANRRDMLFMCMTCNNVYCLGLGRSHYLDTEYPTEGAYPIAATDFFSPHHDCNREEAKHLMDDRVWGRRELEQLQSRLRSVDANDLKTLGRKFMQNADTPENRRSDESRSAALCCFVAAALRGHDRASITHLLQSFPAYPQHDQRTIKAALLLLVKVDLNDHREGADERRRVLAEEIRAVPASTLKAWGGALRNEPDMPLVLRFLQDRGLAQVIQVLSGFTIFIETGRRRVALEGVRGVDVLKSVFQRGLVELGLPLATRDIRFLYRGEELKPERTVEDYGMFDGDTFIMLIITRGD